MPFGSQIGEYLVIMLRLNKIKFLRSTWSDEGVSTSKVGDSVECITTHLTSFSVLVDVHGTAPPHGSVIINENSCSILLTDKLVRLCRSSATLAVVYQLYSYFLQCLQLVIGGMFA